MKFFSPFSPDPLTNSVKFHTVESWLLTFQLFEVTHTEESIQLGASKTSMHFVTFALLTGAITVVNAHFRLAYPPPRGPYDGPNEVNFCDNYINAVSNRSEFPLSGGYITLHSSHVNWNFGMWLSTAQNPTSFDNFTTSSGQQQIVRGFANATGSGDFCIPLDLSNTGISGVADGANVTVQFVYNGGDQNLYQCTDLTLSNNFTIPSNISCNNVSTTSTSAAPTATATGNYGASGMVPSVFASALGFLLALIMN